ncbi:MAG: DUF885 domain-containing protein [Candidatus Dormibacteraeota bacterium]|nr:DUF885 domain-containing protein [Candidatus Dormibacteraeota bacterium]
MPPWTALEHAVVDGVFRFAPAHARVVGDHAYDGIVGDVSSTAIRARAEEITRQLSVLAHADDLTPGEKIDRRALQGQLQGSQFELTEQRTPFKDPLFYAGSGSELDVSPYLKREYAPLPARLASLRQHLRGYAGYLEAARDNLEQSLPGPNLEIAIEAAAGQADYLESDVRTAASGDDATLAAIDDAASQVRAFTEFLRSRRSTAHEHDPLGSERFERILAVREMVDLPVARLERMVRADVERNTARATELAAEIAPGKGIAGALAELAHDHPTVTSLIEDVTGMLESIRRFVVERDLLSIPSEVRCTVKPTPAYASYISAALDSAGPLESTATESYYYVTVPTPAWGPAKTEEWLRYLNYAVLRNVSIHEAYPGHYVQSLHERHASSLTRRVFWVQGTGEGYAHYCEEMMIEAGFSQDPKAELAQKADALLRDCRALVALGLHCQGMTMREAVAVFMEVGLQSELPAWREATRGAWDPLYLTYTLGKLLIYELRQDHAAREGYSLKAFHDGFLAAGNLPIPLIRELLD